LPNKTIFITGSGIGKATALALAKKIVWMNHKSYFYSVIEQIQKMEARKFKWSEQKDITSIVQKIIEVTKLMLLVFVHLYHGGRHTLASTF